MCGISQCMTCMLDSYCAKWERRMALRPISRASVLGVVYHVLAMGVCASYIMTYDSIDARKRPKSLLTATYLVT